MVDGGEQARAFAQTSGARFTKKPVTISAVQLRAGEIPGDTFIHEGIVASTLLFRDDGTCLVGTAEGVMNASPGDWIIRGVEGELYPCRDSVFQATYVVTSRQADGTGAPALTSTEADGVVERSRAPRVTAVGIMAKIAGSKFFRDGVLTICIITMRNGFTFVGKSACVSPENYDQAAGERYAYDDAFEQIWGFEAYALRNKLSGESA